MKKLLLLPFILFGLAASATDYYISSSNGNDLNNGVTPSTAWKTINKLNSFFSSLKGGDRILLKRGDKFYGKIQIIRGGTISSPIVIGDFGTGEKPILSGFSNVTQWTSKGSNIWESTTEVSSVISLNMVVINGQNTAMGRFPNSGFFTYQSHSGKGQITSSSLTGGLNWAGAEIAIFITSYGLNRGKIISQLGNTINFSYNDLQENIQRDNQGFFIQNDERTLDLQNEWYYNSNTKKLKLYSTYEPVNVQVSAIEALIEVQDISNVIVQNIDFEGSNSASVLLKNAQNISLRNCGFNYSGINAIHGPFWGNSAGLIIDNCSFDHSNNTAIALQAEFGNSTITNNKIRNTGKIPGMGAPAGDYSYTGLYSGIHATGNGSVIENNLINNSAYNGITFAGSNSSVQNNFIDTACTFLHDGAGIYTWNGSGAKLMGVKILNNIVLNVEADCGIYTDDGSNGIEISGNSVSNCHTGFYFHNNWDLLIQGNTSFDNSYAGVSVYNDDPSVTMSNNIMKNNLFVGNSPIQRAAFFYPMEKVVTGFSILDNNYYAVPIKDTYTIDGCINGTWGRKTLDEWKVTSGKEANSKKSPKAISQSDYLKFEYNATSSPQNKILDARYVDLSGNIFNGSVNLLPFTSVVLIRDGELINNPPTANAGANVSITLPTNTATLNGSGLDSDGTISSYKWVKISGPGAYNIFNVNAAVTNVSGLTEGTYQFELTVTDNIGATAKSSVLVTVSPAINILPVANAGSTRSITLPINSVQLSGIGTDADGTIVGYKWTYVSGPGSYYIINDASAVTDVTGLAEGIYKFELTVTDNSGATAKSRVQVNVNPANNISPTANAGSAQQITLPLNFVKLSGTGIDTDGTIVSYKWAKTSGPSIYNIVDGTSAITDATGLTEGIYYFEITVTDNKGATGKSSVQVTVSHAINIPPIANAGSDQQITLPVNSIILSGIGLDTDGTIVNYQWSKISGPSGYNILNAASYETGVAGLTEGIYEFELTVTDNNGSSAISIVQVTVLAAINIPPTVSAGSSQVITLPLKTVSLKGAATDIDGTIVKYQWTKISGPLGFNIVNALSAETGVIDLAEGIYNFELTVTDNKGATAKSSVQVFVNPAINIPPTANAGSNKSITLPLNTVSLTGTGTDTDGTIVSYKWTKISGPANYNIVVANSAETDVTGLIEGIYKFQLTVTDNNGSSAISNVQVTVNGIVNISPVASAGNDKSITLPIDNVLLKGTGTDSDGTIVSYHWAKISGPSSYNILNGGSAETEVTGLTEGFYNFELTITDDQGATAKSGVQVTVSPEINIPPVANAGGNKSITLPIDNVLLTGSGTDTDGTIVSYQWTKISGPASYNIVSETSAETDVTGLAEGIYQFELTVTDHKGATAKSNAQVIVNAVFNIPPTADAGSNKSITLPVNTVSFKGTGTDTDGAISSYQWTKKSGPSSYNIIDAASATTEVSGLIEGVYNFELTVTDNKGATATSSVEVIVNRALNVQPTANAGIDLDITLPVNNVSLTGSGTDSDGNIVSYKWMKVSGPAGFTITNSDSANTDINDLAEGIYQFELTVTDDKNSTATSSVLVTVSPVVNIPPVASAGTNKTITLPVNTVTLSGSGTDVDGTIVSYHWMKTSGPASFTIINPDSSKVDISDLVEGVYEFELTVIDNAGAGTSSTVQVIVNPANNIPPTANAGANQSITLPINVVSLDGSGLDIDGTILSYKWSKVSGPFWYTIHNSSSATTDVSGLIQGTYKFQLTVTDNKGSKASATVQVIVKAAVNIPPSVSAGSDQQITLPTNSVGLSGTGTDADGTIVSYKWTKVSGPSSYSIVNAASAATNVTGLREGIYQFELTVTDNKGATGKSSVLVTVSHALNIPPIANAGSNTSITLPVNTVSLIGSGADNDGTIVAYQWTKVSGPSQFSIINPGSATTGINSLAAGTYEFELTVTDNDGAFAKSTVQVTVNEAINIPPAANAGSNVSIRLPVNTVSLAGTGTDTDGTIVSYKWSKISGHSQFTITDSDSSKANVTDLVEGIYEFELTVTDNKGANASATIQVTVNEAINISPTANAGIDKSITLPGNTVSLTGSGTDVDGTIVSYSWRKVSGPILFTIVNPGSSNTDINNLVEGIYQFELTVTDNKGSSSISTMQVIVNAAINIAPTSNAGSNKSITLPVNTVSLIGAGADTDGTITKYQWTKISGPSIFNFVNASAAMTDVSGLLEGIYNFELTVTDNKGATAKSSVQVTVNPAVNIPPTANAGSNKNITLPVNTVSLTGTGTDTDGTVANYKWVKISGPSSYNIVNNTSATTDVSALAEGIYNFELTVTDNKGATAKSTVQVTVNQAINIPPTANAGSGKSITLPVNTVSLIGTGTDTDGTVASYKWIKISGPSSYNIVSNTSSTTQITALTEGIYNFELTVTDNRGATAKSSVQVTVNPAINIPPTANAGSNQSIILPVNTVSLTGTGTDTDGSVASYKWTKISGPSSYNIVKNTSAITDVTGLTEGIYQFELAVTDNKGAIANSSVSVTVNAANNVPPTANAGSNNSVTLPNNSVSLAGSGADVDGTIASYKWTKVSGPSGYTFVNASSAVTDVFGLTEGVYKFELTVTDNKGATAKSSVQISVNPANNILPTANAGSNKSITLPINTVSLAGSGSDADGAIASYKWIKLSGSSNFNIINAASAVTDVTGLTEGIYQFELTVTDNKGSTAKSSVQVTVNPANNISPTANAGSNKSITLPVNTVSLNGSGADIDGTIVSYKWTKVSGPSDYTIVNAASVITDVTSLSEGVYNFELTVTDNKGATAKSSVQVIVNAPINIAPISNAGSNKIITLPVNTVSLNGSGADIDGTIVSYKWTKISGPSGFYITSADSNNTDVSNLEEGVYKFELAVTDNKGAIATAVVQVTVNAAINIPPTANAGSNITITLPVNTVSLTGTGKDIDGTIVSYKWTKISGPSNFNIVNEASPVTSVSGLTEGVYSFELNVTDNKGATGASKMQVIVNAANNIPPIANAGGNKSITLPVNTVSLNGSGTDTDGTIVSYKWTKISGPSSYNIVNTASAVTDVFGLTEGVYKFELTVTDNKGAIATAVVQVTVNAAINIPPTANAGNNKTITLPVNTVSLNGSGADIDGTVVSYKWTKISGPSNFNIVNAASAVTSVSGLTEGVYSFELNVTDNKGATGASKMQVTVNAAINIPPTASAGSNKSITLPLNTVSLNGSGTDTDGTIVSYKWTKISGPSSYNIVNTASAVTDVFGLTEGVYKFELTVTDNKGTNSKSIMQITVNAVSVIPNKMPNANAGEDITITIPTNFVTLTGNGTDGDGTVVKYKWNQISGPQNSNIVSINEAVTDVNNLVGGTYEFELSVTDNAGGTGKDTVVVVVALGRLAATQEENSFRVYPNPIIDVATVDVNLKELNTNLTLIVEDINGRVILRKNFKSAQVNIKEEINLSNQKKGAYIVTVYYNAKERQSVQVVKL